jgi:hypothetical protein
MGEKKMKLTYEWEYAPFYWLRKLYGASATTTYCWLRVNDQPAWFAWQVMNEQIKELGIHYPGGLDCTPFRKMRLERI